MKVPNRIKESIRLLAYYNELTTTLDNKIRLWLEKKNIVDENFEPTKEEYMEVPIFYIDSLENSDGHEAFIKVLEEL